MRAMQMRRSGEATGAGPASGSAGRTEFDGGAADGQLCLHGEHEIGLRRERVDAVVPRHAEAQRRRLTRAERDAARVEVAVLVLRWRADVAGTSVHQWRGKDYKTCVRLVVELRRT